MHDKYNILFISAGRECSALTTSWIAGYICSRAISKNAILGSVLDDDDETGESETTDENVDEILKRLAGS